MMEKAFYFNLKALFVFKIFRFLSSLFGHVEKQLYQEDKANLKFMTSKPGKQTMAIHILLNISRSESNQPMKFDQLIDYNMRNIFLEKSYTKCGEETIPRSFSKKRILVCFFLADLWINNLMLHTVCFYHMAS